MIDDNEVRTLELQNFGERLAGLIPRRRGPKGGHKLTRDMVAFAEQSRLQEPALATAELVRQIQKKFSVQVHRRTLERALMAAKKKRRSP